MLKHYCLVLTAFVIGCATTGELSNRTYLDEGKTQYIDSIRHENGNLKEIIHFKNEQRHGTYKEWSPDGVLITQGEYINGQKNGQWYSADYSLVTKTDYYQKPMKGDTTIISGYYISNYLSGKKHGLMSGYTIIDGDTVLISKYSYNNDLHDGENILYYENGQKREISHWQNGVLNGEYIVWHPNGQKSEVSYWQNDTINGENLKWYPNGQLKSKTYWRNGKQDGLSEYWYDNGVLYNRIDWTFGEKSGKEVWWYRDGDILAEILHDDTNLLTFYNKKESVKITWDTDGKIISEDNYTPDNPCNEDIHYGSDYFKGKPTDGKRFIPYDTPPQVIGGFDPLISRIVIPDKFKGIGVKLEIKAQVYVHESGAATDIILTGNVDRDQLDGSVKTAIAKTRFEPAKNRGRNTAVYISIPLKFNL